MNASKTGNAHLNVITDSALITHRVNTWVEIALLGHMIMTRMLKPDVNFAQLGIRVMQVVQVWVVVHFVGKENSLWQGACVWI